VDPRDAAHGPFIQPARTGLRLYLSLLLLFFLAACSAGQSPASEEAEFAAAVEAAHSSLDQFIQRIAQPHPNRTFVALKVRFTSPDGSYQDIWVDNVSYERGRFTGSMGDDIPALKLAFGDRITIPEDDILDWMVVEDGVLVGGFTIRLAYEQMTPEEQQRFLEAADYKIK
jgi:uncharacterized protein YegJ (DUF2314 family)